jgi:hypothetical protein
MRSVQTGEHGDLSLCVSGVPGIGESQHRAIAHVSHQQNAAGAEGHLPGMWSLGEDSYMKTGGKRQPAQVQFLHVGAGE